MQNHNVNTPLPTKVFITIDVECGEYSPNYEGCVWGRLANIPRQEYGLPLIIKLLAQYRLKAVFFVEALSALRHGVDNLKYITNKILSEGHEIQLHLHPSLRHLTRKAGTEIHIGKYPLKDQVAFIDNGLNLLAKCGVDDISTFRAGGFGISNDTYHALLKCGLSCDTSFNLNYFNTSCFLDFPGDPPNDAFVHQGIVEFPVTCFRNPWSMNNPIRHMQITAVSFGEMRESLLLANMENMNAVTIILHSFEFIRFFDKMRTVGKPVSINIRRFEKLLQFLSVNKSTFEVCGFANLQSTYLNHIKASKNTSGFIPKGTLRLKFWRQFEQIMSKI